MEKYTKGFLQFIPSEKESKENYGGHHFFVLSYHKELLMHAYVDVPLTDEILITPPTLRV